jgi:hypothetical protein
MTLAVRLCTEDPEAVKLHRTVLSSLPRSFRVDGQQLDVALLSGRDLDWAARARSALRVGARGALLAAPWAASSSAVREVAEDARRAAVPIVVDRAYGADPVWIGVLDRLRADLPSCALLESVVSVRERGLTPTAHLRAGLVEQLAAVEELLGECEFVPVQRGEHQYLARTHRGGLLVELVGVGSPAANDRLALDLVGVERRWSARFSGEVLARPTVVTAHHVEGCHEEALQFESSHRRCWQQLYDAVDQERTEDGLDQLVRRLSLASAVLAEMPVP